MSTLFPFCTSKFTYSVKFKQILSIYPNYIVWPVVIGCGIGKVEDCWHKGNLCVPERELLRRSHWGKAAFIYEETLLVDTAVFKAPLVSLLTIGIVVWLAKPIPGGIEATVPFNNKPFTAFIETWILDFKSKLS